MSDVPLTVPGSLAVVLLGLALLLILGSGLILDARLLLRRFRAKSPALPPEAPPEAPPVERPWTWHDGGLIACVLLGMHAAALLLFGCLPALSRNPESKSALQLAIVAETLAFHGAGLAAVLWIMRARGVSWRQAFGCPGRTPATDVRVGLSWYAAVLPPVFAASLAFGALLLALGYPIEPQPVVSLFTDPGTPRWLVAYLVFVAVAVAPPVEEILFRGVALPVLARHFGPRTAVLLVSAVFAAIHFHLPSLAPLLVIAAGFALAYLRTGSLLVSITMHVLFNGVNVLMLFILRDVPNLPLGQ